MRNKNGICPKCFQVRKLTRHHVLFKKFYGHTDCVLLICRDCHDEIHSFISAEHKFSKEEYFQIHRAWLEGKNILTRG